MSEQVPLVSVCITAYNHENYIRESVMSVLRQEGAFELELLIGDDGSSDGTRKIVSELQEMYPKYIRHFFHDINLGASGNLSFLVSQTHGQYIAHLDGDDFWLPRKLEIQLNELTANQNITAVYCNGKVIDDTGRHIGTFNSINHKMQINLNYLLSKGNFLLHSSILYRSIFKDQILSIAGNFIDYRIHIRLAEKGRLSHLGELLAVYRYSSSSSMSKKMPRMVAAGYWDAIVESTMYGEKIAATSCAELFWQKIFIKSLVTLDFSNLIWWWNVYTNNNELPFLKSRLIWLSIKSLKQIFLAIYKRMLSPKSMVLFPR
jgi:glycosyltransferase involved in cell wall biosynthesis